METTAYPERSPLWVAQMPCDEYGTRRINSVLIANRGEIACRVIATCRKLQVRSIAIYADEDAISRHVNEADEAISLGSIEQPGGNPFLNIQLLVETAQFAQADAIHPGYGYLSENAQFADAVRKAGIIFIGPSSSAITTLGDKREAKEFLSRHEPSVPLIPGYTGSSTGIQLDDLEEQSEQIGFPVMIKASAGGGGRGLRIVRDRTALKSEFERAQSEAQRSFGLKDCILEKYIEAGKHVEVQILGDSHGNVISLWERDCSVQRRHQKVVEESPCAWLSQQQREEMCAVAVQIGRRLKYEGAGTVEFILDLETGRFYFLEVNARLQVEHPITEECTNLDIVSLQLFVASGGNLADIPTLQHIPQNGHAIECRLCAEDPQRGFAPQHGLIRLWAPATTTDKKCVRFETAVESGAKVSIYFDSMIAKIVVWAPSRSMAIDRMAKVLAGTVCIGISTNQLFLQACLLHPEFRRVDYTTSFIPSHLDTLLKNPYQGVPNLSQELLSIVPSLFLRNIRQKSDATGAPKVFGTIRKSFRNQWFDRVNVPCDIVTIYDPIEGTDINPQICVWKFNSHSLGGDTEVKISPFLVTGGTSNEDQNVTRSTVAINAYNNLSRAIRRQDLPNSITKHVKMHNFRAQTRRFDSQLSCTFGQIEVSIGKSKVHAYVVAGDHLLASGEPDTADALSIYCHFSSLGAPIEYHCYSSLSYFENQRISQAGGSQDGLAVIKAPMPCKVLQVLKKDGDQVKIGEVVMIIESMKMEITISAGKDGCFEPSVKEGEAVNEGVQLCIVN